MSKFFSVGRDNQNSQNNIRPSNMNNDMNNYPNDGQGYPNDMYGNNYNQPTETFVYNQNYQNQVNTDNFDSMIQAENYMPNNQVNNYNNYDNNYNNYNNMNYGDMDVLDENGIINPQNNIESQAPVLDPLNNANNPIPVNPVAPAEQNFVEEELPSDVKANVFSVIGMMLGMILTPGTTIVTNSKKYRSTGKALMVTTWITIVTMILCIGVRIIVGAFNKTYSAVTASYHINFDFTNILSVDNYIQYLIVAFAVSFVAILIVALIYYASSFLNSKGIPFGSYLMVSNLALLPLIIGVVALYPVASLISTYVALLVLIFTFLYSVVSFLTGIGEVLTFKNINREILYNVLNLSVIVLIMIVIFIILLNTSVIIMPDLHL